MCFLTSQWRNRESVVLGSIFGGVYLIVSLWLHQWWLPYLYFGLTITVTCTLMLRIDFPPPGITFGTIALTIPLSYPVLIATSMSVTQRMIIMILGFWICAAITAAICIIFGIIMYFGTGGVRRNP